MKESEALSLGQIRPHSPMGIALIELATQSELIVEAGTRFGLGTTLCLFHGLRRSSQRLFSYEPRENCHKIATQWYNDSRVKIIRGPLPLTGWSTIDLLVLDGSAETSDEQFDALAPLAHIVALDDTNSEKANKNPRNRAKLLESPHWKVLHDRQDNRNGWIIAQRL